MEYGFESTCVFTSRTLARRCIDFVDLRRRFSLICTTSLGVLHLVRHWYRTSVPVYQPICMGKQCKIADFWYVPGNSWYISLTSPQYVNIFSALDRRSYTLNIVYTNAKNYFRHKNDKNDAREGKSIHPLRLTPHLRSRLLHSEHATL